MPASSGPRPPAGRAGGPLVRVHDGAVPARLVRALARAVRALGTERLRDTFQTAFWYDLGPPACLAEEAAQAVRPLALALAGGRLAGVEWWLSRMRTSDVRVDFHRDRDEVLFARTGRTRHPATGSVLFLNRCRGGLLAVTAQPADDANPARAPLPLDADLVRPRAGRLALFPGDATHGVLDARGAIPDRRLSPPAPLRLALVMNWWRRRPEGRPTFAEAGVYRRLRGDGARRGGCSPAPPLGTMASAHPAPAPHPAGGLLLTTTYRKKNRRDPFIVMRDGHHGDHALVCCECGTLVVAGPLSASKKGCACPRAGCESHYYTERAPTGDSYLVGMKIHAR